MLLLQVVVFSFTLWFGFYLLGRDARKPGLRFAGLGLVSYALGLSVNTLLTHAPEAAAGLYSWRNFPVLLPSVFWVAAVLYLLPDASSRRINDNALIALALLILALLGAAALDTAVARLAVTLVPVGFSLWALLRVWLAFRRDDLPRQPLATLFTATLFFALGIGLLLLPTEIITTDWVLLAISTDLLLLGYAIGVLDAYDEGTSLLPDALRSLAAAALAVIVIGGQVLLVMFAADLFNPALLLLLFTSIGTVIALENFSDSVQLMLDKLIFARRAQLQQEREALRAVSRALPQTQTASDFITMSDDEFIRLTRRALSHYNDLNKLATSPLTYLPAVETRLALNGHDDTLLERTAELKKLLRECIDSLKPADDRLFSPADEWRYYNVLYFPYIAGLKPYSRRASYDDLSDEMQAALDWFQTYVPERTLYNWQTTAAKLVAQQLRAMMQSEKVILMSTQRQPRSG